MDKIWNNLLTFLEIRAQRTLFSYRKIWLTALIDHKVFSNMAQNGLNLIAGTKEYSKQQAPLVDFPIFRNNWNRMRQLIKFKLRIGFIHRRLLIMILVRHCKMGFWRNAQVLKIFRKVTVTFYVQLYTRLNSINSYPRKTLCHKHTTTFLLDTLQA